MLRFIMEKNVLLYVLAAACAVGVVSQMILRRIYDGLLRDTKTTGEPEGRFLQQLRQRFQYCAHLNGKVGDVQALIQKSMMEYRVLGMSLHSFKRLGGGCLTVSLLCAAFGTVARMQQGAAIVIGNTYFWLGAGAIVLTALAYGIADTRYWSSALEICLCDYLQNGQTAGGLPGEDEIPDLAYETASERISNVSVLEGRRAKRRAKAAATADSIRGQRGAKELARTQKESDLTRTQREEEPARTQRDAEPVRAQRESELPRAQREGGSSLTRAQREKNDLKENLARMKAGLQESAASDSEHSGGSRGAELLRQMDPKDQERLIREVLSEFLSQ